jgi:DNA-binding NarL/FixJ family response regulator
VLHVMLVDDHAVVRAGYRRLLELEPDCVVSAECGDADSAYNSVYIVRRNTVYTTVYSYTVQPDPKTHSFSEGVVPGHAQQTGEF